MVSSSTVLPPFPHIAVLVCVLQYGLGPWAAHYFPAVDFEYSIPDPPHYFAYAGPALVAIALGWLLGCTKLYSHAPPQHLYEHKDRSLAERDLNRLLWGGLALRLVFGSRAMGGLSFLFMLLGDLRFVGGMGLMLLRAPGWRWKVGLLLVLELSGSVSAGMFHELILWLLSFFALYAFTSRLRRSVYVAWLIVMAVGVFCLSDAKWQIRQAVWFGGENVQVWGWELPITKWNRPLVGAACLAQSTTKLLTGGFTEDSIGDTCMRFNQGWIVDRVLWHVPAGQPYAGGETVVSAIKAALLPRILAPGKATAGGRAFMERFANYSPGEGTSMSIGFVGETYANFGLWGGAFSCGIYALVLALCFRWLSHLAQKSLLWWSFGFYVLHWAIKAETDISTVFNFITKAVIVVVAVTYLLPSLRAELFGQPAVGPTRRPVGRPGPLAGGTSVAAGAAAQTAADR
jgi:hypothetical protein